MKIILNALLLVTPFLAGPALGAEDAATDGGQGRRCNLQAREIALRISEEVSGRISAPERQQIAAIAEEVCLDYAGNTGMGRRQVMVDQADVEVEDAGDEDEGLLGGFKIIGRDERPKHGGMKRP